MDEPEEWMAKAKRRGALRLTVIGAALLLGGGLWALGYWDYGVADSPISYVRVVSVLILGIGAGLALAGGLAFARIRAASASIEALPRAAVASTRSRPR